MSKGFRFALSTVAVGLIALPGLGAAQTKPSAGAAGVKVTVKYTGKGTVDTTRRLWVWLFDNPNIGPGSIPVAEQSLDKNGSTATFENVTAKEVYIAVAYDEKGGFIGQAPPPPGSPVAFYGVKSPKDPPQAVVPGATASVTVTFADEQRMQ